jgi:hypothetical protein
MGPIAADVSATVATQPHQNHNVLITNNDSSITMLNGPSHHATTSTANPLAFPLLQTETDINNQQPLMLPATEKNQQLLDNNFSLIPITGLSPFNCQSISIPSLPSHHLAHNNNHINASSLSNNSLIFTSQSKITPPLKQINRKQLIFHRTQPTKIPTRTETLLTQVHMNSNQPDDMNPLYRTETEPETLNPNQNSADDMDTQTERKRQREARNQMEKTDEELSQHFLSAGPGSQDCREQ